MNPSALPNPCTAQASGGTIATMRRFQLFEFNDQSWLPGFFRRGTYGFLDALSQTAGFHKRMAPIIDDALQRSGADRIVDLGSGFGGTILDVPAELGRTIPITLTDRFPEREALAALAGDDVSVRLEAIDASDVPDDLTGLRTVINTFHHMSPETVQGTLQDAVDHGQPLVMLELSERRWSTVLTSPFIALAVLFLMPLVRPMRLSYLFFTYLVPLLPLIIFWDGLVSHLRSYTIAELEDFTRRVDATGYDWSIQRVTMGGGARGTLLVGMPEQKAG